ncbi:MAG: hypothetical protein RLO12_03830, partial [Fulvivirga sp.]
MRFIYVLLLLVIVSCSPNNKSETPSFNNLMDESPSITGKPEYLNSPFVTAGDRVYVVGHQDGSFPELGWHIKD